MAEGNAEEARAMLSGSFFHTGKRGHQPVGSPRPVGLVARHPAESRGAGGPWFRDSPPLLALLVRVSLPR